MKKKRLDIKTKRTTEIVRRRVLRKNWFNKGLSALKNNLLKKFFFSHFSVINLAKVVLKCAVHNFRGYPYLTVSVFNQHSQFFPIPLCPMWK